jgi:HEAT repeat protein
MSAAPRSHSALVDVATFGAFMAASLWTAGSSVRGLGLAAVALAAFLLARRGPACRVIAIVAFLASWFGSAVAGAVILVLAWWWARPTAPNRGRLVPDAVPEQPGPAAAPPPPTPDDLERQLREAAGEGWALLAIDHGDPEVCRRGVVALTGAPGGPPVEAMARVLGRVEYGRFDDAQLAAAKSLAVPGLVGAVPALLSVLESREHVWWLIQEAAVRALRRIGDPAVCGRLVALYAKDDGLLEREITEALRGFGDPAVPCLREGIRGEVPLIRSRCARALSRMGRRDCAAVLAGALSDAAAEVRASAAAALGHLRVADARETIEDALGDSAIAVRAAAARALGQIGDRRSAEALIGLASKETLDDILREVVEALGALGDARAAPVLEGVFSRTPLRTAAAEALVRIGGCEAQAAVRPHLRSRDFPTRLAAIQTAAALHDEAAVDRLREIAKLQDTELAAAAIEAIRTIVGPRSEEEAALAAPSDEAACAMHVSSMPELGWAQRRKTAGALLAAGQRAVGALDRGLKTPNPLVRWWCAEVLRRLGGEQAREILERVARDEPDERVRRRASAGV